jgi:hypothetical protein
MAAKSAKQLDTDIAEALAKRGGAHAKRLKHPVRSSVGILPEATMEQRLASMSTTDLMIAARGLAKKTDEASDRACTAVLDALEKRLPADTFERFTAEIFAT